VRLSPATQLTLLLFVGMSVWAVAADDAFWPATLLGALAAPLLHEVGHVVGAALVGVEVDEVRVTPFGGAVTYAGEPDDAQRAAVSMAGPAASALGALTALLLPVLDGETLSVVAALSGLSVWHVVVNLVPIGGTDGGETLRALRRRAGSRSRSSGGPAAR
jgi:Zn-dependent protease